MRDFAGLRRERALASPRFKDGRFENTEPVRRTMREGSMWSTTKEYFFGGAVKRPPGELPIEDPREAWRSDASSGLRITWLGHSTVLLEIDGFRVLTDPVWGEHLSPIPLLGPKRFHRVPVAIEQLPPLDAILVSHDHFDHLDYPTMRAFAVSRRFGKVPIYTSLGVGARLEEWGIAADRIVELDWWEEATLQRPGTKGALTFTATPARHFSGRSIGDRNRTLWSSWVLETDRRRLFFSGDTGLTPELEEVHRRKGRFDLVMLEVGAFHPAWGEIHLGPDNALRALAMLGGGTLLPVHWGTFDLALHAWDEPAETLVAAAAKEGARLVTPRLGRAVEPDHVEGIDPWWRQVTATANAAASRSRTQESSAEQRDGTSAHGADGPILVPQGASQKP